jgi:NAD(P)H dehydrogenase (quinone)
MTDDMQANRYLALGVTGAQGGAIARALARHGAPVRGFARREPSESIPGVDVVTGDLADAAAVERAFDGITHAAVTLPLVYDEAVVTGYARNIAAAARAAGVRMLVFNTNTTVPTGVTPYPAFETRRAAEVVLRDAGVALVVLRPPVYLDNLFTPGPGPAVVDHGVLAYPLPADRRVAWLSHDDLAVAVDAALHRPELAGRAFDIGGADVVTGPELAAAFARALGRDVRYQPLDVEDFQNGLAHALGAEAAAGVAGLYRWAGTEDGRHLYDLDRAVLRDEVGVRATPLADWVAGRPWQVWSQAVGQR